MYKDDAVVLPEFTRRLFQALSQPHMPTGIKVYLREDGVMPPFPNIPKVNMDDEDAAAEAEVRILLSLPTQLLEIPHPQAPAINPALLWFVAQQLELSFLIGFNPRQCQPEEPLIFVRSQVTITQARELWQTPLTMHAEDLPVILDNYRFHAVDVLGDLYDAGDYVLPLLTVSPFERRNALRMERLELTLPCHLTRGMLGNASSKAFLMAVEPWVAAYTKAAGRFFQFLAQTLCREVTIRGRGDDAYESSVWRFRTANEAGLKIYDPDY